MGQETASPSSVDLKTTETTTKPSSTSPHGESWLTTTEASRPLTFDMASHGQDMTERDQTTTTSTEEWKIILDKPFAGKGDQQKLTKHHIFRADPTGSYSSNVKDADISQESSKDSEEIIWLMRHKSGFDEPACSCSHCRETTLLVDSTEKHDATQSDFGGSRVCPKCRTESAESEGLTDATEGVYDHTCRHSCSDVNTSVQSCHDGMDTAVMHVCQGSTHHVCTVSRTHSCGFTCDSASSAEKGKPMTSPFSEKATSYSKSEPTLVHKKSPNRYHCTSADFHADINSSVTLKTPSHSIGPSSCCQCSESYGRCPMCDGTLKTEDLTTEENTRSNYQQQSHSCRSNCAPSITPKIKPCLKKPNKAQDRPEDGVECDCRSHHAYREPSSAFKAAPGYSKSDSTQRTESALTPTHFKSELTSKDELAQPRILPASVQLRHSHHQWEQKTGSRGKPSHNSSSSGRDSFDEKPMMGPSAAISEGTCDSMLSEFHDKETALSTCEECPLPGLNRTKATMLSEMNRMKRSIEDSVTMAPECPDIIVEEPNCVNCMLQGMQNEEVACHSPYYTRTSHEVTPNPTAQQPPSRVQAPLQERSSSAERKDRTIQRVDQARVAKELEKALRQAEETPYPEYTFETAAKSSDVEVPQQKGQAEKQAAENRGVGQTTRETASSAKAFTEKWKAVQNVQLGRSSPPNGTASTTTSDSTNKKSPGVNDADSEKSRGKEDNTTINNRCEDWSRLGLCISALRSEDLSLPLPTAEEIGRCLEILALEAEKAHCGENVAKTVDLTAKNKKKVETQDRSPPQHSCQAENEDIRREIAQLRKQVRSYQQTQPADTCSRTGLKPVTSQELEKLEDLRRISEMLNKECKVSGQLDVPECDQDAKQDVDMIEKMTKDLLTIRAPGPLGDGKDSGRANSGRRSVSQIDRMFTKQPARTSGASPDPCLIPSMQKVEINYEKLAREIRQQQGISDFNIRDIADPEVEAEKIFRSKCPTCEPSAIFLSSRNQEGSPRSLRDSVAVSTGSPGGSDTLLTFPVEGSARSNRLQYEKFGTSSIGTVEPRCTECLIKLPIGKAQQQQQRSRMTPAHMQIFSHQNNATTTTTRIGESMRSRRFELQVPSMVATERKAELEMSDEERFNRRVRSPVVTRQQKQRRHRSSTPPRPTSALATTMISSLMSPPSPPSIPDVPRMPPSNDKRFVTFTVGEGLKMTKAVAHDNITTPNVPLSGYAYAFPRLSHTPRADSPMIGIHDLPKPAYGVGAPTFTYRGEKIPPNCISIVPTARTRISSVSRR